MSLGNPKQERQAWALVILAIAAATIMVYFLFPKYNSYGECMAEFESDKLSAEQECPGCNNWRELREYNEKRCSAYRKSWEN